MKTSLRIHERDNVAVALRELARGSSTEDGVTIRDDVPFGHKAEGSPIEVRAFRFRPL